MDETRSQQAEAVSVAAEYCGKLETAIENAVTELTKERYADTDEYIKKIIDGLNWTFQIYNRTKGYLFEIGAEINEDEVNHAVVMMNEGIKNKDDAMVADAFSGGILNFVKKMKTAPELAK